MAEGLLSWRKYGFPQTGHILQAYFHCMISFTYIAVFNKLKKSRKNFEETPRMSMKLEFSVYSK